MRLSSLISCLHHHLIMPFPNLYMMVHGWGVKDLKMEENIMVMNFRWVITTKTKAVLYFLSNILSRELIRMDWWIHWATIILCREKITHSSTALIASKIQNTIKVIVLSAGGSLPAIVTKVMWRTVPKTILVLFNL